MSRRGGRLGWGGLGVSRAGTPEYKLLANHSLALKRYERILRVPGNLGTMFLYLVNKSARPPIFHYQTLSI